MSSVWETRWQTLDSLLIALAKQYHHAAQTDPWMDTMHTLIERLRLFGRSQFQFCLYQEGCSKNKTLGTTTNHPKEHILHATLNQITYDMALFQHAIGQRKQTQLQPILHKADKVAQFTINLATCHKLLKETSVITYFGKTAKMHIVAYAPITLIAIPHTNIDVALFWQMVLNMNCSQINQVHFQQTSNYYAKPVAV